MKNLLPQALILLSIGFSTTFIQAQVSKGQWMLGGYGYIDPDRFININISPTGGYMISENFAVGAILGIEFSNYEQGYAFSNYLVPTVRYYFGKSKTQPFLMAGFGLGHYARFNDYNNEDHSVVSYYGGAAIGLSHFINKNIALEVMAGYSNSPITKFRGTFINFGFQIFLNKKNHEEE